jgi:hypothetical protein
MRMAAHRYLAPAITGRLQPARSVKSDIYNGEFYDARLEKRAGPCPVLMTEAGMKQSLSITGKKCLLPTGTPVRVRSRN